VSWQLASHQSKESSKERQGMTFRTAFAYKTKKETKKTPQVEYFNLEQLASYSSLSVSFLRNCLEKGMPCYRVGRSILVKRNDFDGWMRQFRSTEPPKGNEDFWAECLKEAS